MLQLAYTLQERFSKVRSFVFVSDLGDATELFESNEIERAVEKTYSGAIVSVASNSNYGRALRQFVEKHLEAVTSRTTVIVIGDGRSNYFPVPPKTNTDFIVFANHVFIPVVVQKRTVGMQMLIHRLRRRLYQQVLCFAAG